MSANKFLLNAEGIAACLSAFDQINEKYFRDQAQRLKARSVIENILDSHQRFFGEEKSFTFKLTERFRRLYLSFEVRGPGYDIGEMHDFSPEDLNNLILEYSGTFEKKPNYQYVNGVNKISMNLKRERKLSSVGKILIAVIAGLLLSGVGLVLPEFFRTNLLPVCGQINDVVLGLIKMSATLVVFLMVINAITDCGNIQTIKKMGGNVVKGFMLRYAVMIVIIVAYFFLIFQFTLVSPEQKGGLLGTIFGIIAGIFPTSFVSPFAEGNFLQIIFIGVMIGIAVLIVGQPADPFLRLCKSLDGIGNQIMEWCCSLLPVYIALVLPSIFWGEDLSLIVNALIHVAGIILMAYLLFLIFFLIMCSKRKMPVGKSFKIIMPAMLKALLTASSSGTLPEMLEAGKKFGVKEGFNDLSAVFGFIFSCCGQIIAYAILTFYLLVSYNADITVAMIIQLVLSCILLGLASPPVSGGPIAIMAILISMFGLPESSVGIVTPVLIILDFFCTSARCGDIVTQNVISAVNLGETTEE